MISGLWERTDGEAESRLNVMLDSRCSAQQKPMGLYEFLGNWVSGYAKTSVVVERGADISKCWTNACIPPDRSNSWRTVLGTVLPRYGLGYSVQGGAILIHKGGELPGKGRTPAGTNDRSASQ